MVDGKGLDAEAISDVCFSASMEGDKERKHMKPILMLYFFIATQTV